MLPGPEKKLWGFGFRGNKISAASRGLFNGFWTGEREERSVWKSKFFFFFGKNIIFIVKKGKLFL